MKKRLSVVLFALVLAIIASTLVLVSTAEAQSGANVLDVSQGEGMFFDGMSLYHTAKDNCVTEIPVTYEAWVKVPAGYNKEQGVIYGNYEGLEKNGTRFRGFTYGRPYLFLAPEGGPTIHAYFSGPNLANNEWTHYTIVDDTVAGEFRCYINGELVGVQKMTDAQKTASRDVSQRPMCLGGDYMVDTNPLYGSIRSVVVYNDVRTADEIKADMNAVNLEDENLISAYDLNGKKGAGVIKDAAGNYDMINNRATSDWATPEEVPAPTDYAYSIALVGDTQILSAYYPQLYHSYFDWLLENKESHKIAHVLNLGDFTNFNYDWEWDNVRNEWFRLNGEIDYTLVRGDHDVLDDKYAQTDYDKNKYDMWFGVPEYTDRFDKSEDADYYKGENGSITNSYRAIEINGNDYLIVTLDKYPSEDVLSWTETAIQKYPEHRVIMTMHCFNDNDGTLLTEGNIGETIWNRFKGYKNIEMIINGHQYAWGVNWVKAEGTNGNIVNQILVNAQGPDFDQAGPTGMIAMLYFSEDGTDVQVRYYSTVLDKYYIGNYNEAINGYDIDTSVFSIKTDDLSVATPVDLIEKSESNIVPVVPEKKDTVTVEYKEGDNFEEKLEYALKLAQFGDVDFVMYAAYTATGSIHSVTGNAINSVVFGSEISIPQYAVKVVSADSAAPVEINTAGFNLIFWGQVEFDNVIIGGNGAATKNTLFVPEGCSLVIGSNVKCGSSRANLAGANLDISSGVWYMVSAFTDYSVVEGYIDQTVKDDTNRAIFINNPIITLKGTAKAYNLFGGAYSNGNSYNKDKCAFAVLGKSTVNVLGSAIVENFAAASGNSDYSTHDGELNVNTMGTIKRLCAAVGPVGRKESNHIYYPNFTLNIDAVGGEAGGSFCGVWMNKTGTSSSKIYCCANTVINVNGGIFNSSASYGGFNIDSSSVVNVNNYGRNELNIYDGKFAGEVFGGGLFNSANNTDNADIIFNIYDGEFLNNVYGCSRFLQTNCSTTGDAVLTVSGGIFTSVRGGSYFSAAANKSVHGKNTKTYIDGGEYTSNIYGGSYIWGGDSAYKEHKGKSLLEIKSGTFGTNTSIYGSSYMGNKYIKVTGDIELNIYGGVTLSANVFGGALSEGSSGSSYVDGNLVSGNITFNIYDADKNGNKSSASIKNSIYAGSYLKTWWTEMSGDITYNFKGVKVAHATSGGCLLSGGKAKMSGNINGTIDTVTFGGTFYGGSRIAADYASQTGDSTLTLINTNVVSFLAAGPSIEKCGSTDFSGTSTLIYKSGYVSANGTAIGGCYYTVPNVKITGNSKVIFGENSSTASGNPYVKTGGKLVGGSCGSSTSFTTSGKTTEWGMYGSSEVVMNNGEIQTGGYIIGGSCVSTAGTPTTTVDWNNYPIVGGVAGSTNNNHTKLTINGGTVNGPKIYAGSYLANGGQDHGTVGLEVNAGTVNITADGITNYGSTAVATLYPATYYPTNTKNINCNYVLTLNGGSYKIVTSPTRTSISAGMSNYAGNVTGNTTLTLNVGTRAGSNFNNTVNCIVAGMYNYSGVMKGNSTLNIGNMPKSSYDLYNLSVVTYGCYGSNNVTDIPNDGIMYGFNQIGNVYLNITGGTIARPVYAGFKSNIDGNVYVNISGGNINNSIYGTAGNASNYASVTGDVIWNISGGKFASGYGVYGGGIAAASYSPAQEYNVIGGKVYMEINGGTFNGILSLGALNGVQEERRASLKFIGDDFSFGSDAKIYAHGNGTSDFSTAPDTNYILDVVHSQESEEVKAIAQNFGYTIEPIEENAEVTVSNNEMVPNDSLETLIEKIVTIGGITFDYNIYTLFNGYTNYDNTITVCDNEGEVLETLPAYTKNVKLNVTGITTAPIEIKNAFRIVAASLSLQENISINFKAEGSLFAEDGLGYTDPYVLVTVNGEETRINEWTVEAGTGRYVFKFNRIAPNMVGDAVEAVLYATGEDGEVYSQTLSYGVKAYCQSQLKKTTIADSFRTVIVDLLNYGAAAQNYTGYKTDDLANAFLQEDEYKSNLAYATTTLDLSAFDGVAKSDYETVENPVVQMHGANLALSDSVTIRYIVSVADVSDFEGLKIRISKADGSYTWEFDATDESVVEFYKAQDGRQRYYVRFKGLNATEMSDVIYLEFVDAEGNAVSNTLRYSIGCYAFSKQNDSNTTLAEMVKAMMKYGNAAEAWKNTEA